MTKKNILMGFIIVFISNTCYSQSRKLYFCIEDNNLVKNNPIQFEFVKNNNLNNAIVLYQDDFVTHNVKASYKWELLKKSIDEKIPDKAKAGTAILDWEGEKARVLFGDIPSSASKYNEILNEFISAIRAAKVLRPNIKWSYYGLPVRVLKNNTYDEWRTKVFRMLPLFRYCDFISPSLYSFIRPDKAKYEDDINQHLKVSLEIGQMLNKPVIPFVWHRYQTDSSLVPLEEFDSHIQKILNYNYKGLKVKGVIWWNSEGFLKLRKQRYPKVEQEYSRAENANSYQRDVLYSYYNSIKGFFK